LLVSIQELSGGTEEMQEEPQGGWFPSRNYLEGLRKCKKNLRVAGFHPGIYLEGLRKCKKKLRGAN
jgi:hypothetical protein